MDSPAPTDKKSLNLYLIFSAVVVIILLVIGYFTLLAPSSLSRTFFSKYHEQDEVVKQTLPKMQFDYGLLSEQIQAQNASAAATTTKEYLIQSLKNKENTGTIQKKTSELKILLASVTDVILKEKIIKLFELLNQRNKKMQTIIESQTNIFTALRNHFGSLAVGNKGVGIPQNIDSVIQASQTEIQTILQLQTTIDVAYEEIVKLAGVDTTVSQTADSIRMSLSATPEVPVTITDFPTPSPAPTIAPTEISASPSADSATSSAN